LKSKPYPPKGLKNSVRTNNIGRRYSAIRVILRGRGYSVQGNVSQVNVLRIGAPFINSRRGTAWADCSIVLYELKRVDGKFDHELAEFIDKFLGQNRPPSGGPGP
jgi:hypothetical protein